MKRQIDQKTSKQIRIDSSMHHQLKLFAAEQGESIKGVLEDYLSDILAVDKGGSYGKKKQ